MKGLKYSYQTNLIGLLQDRTLTILRLEVMTIFTFVDINDVQTSTRFHKDTKSISTFYFPPIVLPFYLTTYTHYFTLFTSNTLS